MATDTYCQRQKRSPGTVDGYTVVVECGYSQAFSIDASVKDSEVVENGDFQCLSVTTCVQNLQTLRPTVLCLSLTLKWITLSL